MLDLKTPFSYQKNGTAWLNSISKEYFFEDVKLVKDKTGIKINTLWFHGLSNTDKSLIPNSIVELARSFVILLII